LCVKLPPCRFSLGDEFGMSALLFLRHAFPLFRSARSVTLQMRPKIANRLRLCTENSVTLTGTAPPKFRVAWSIAACASFITSG
jgi:hypothetical protein